MAAVLMLVRSRMRRRWRAWLALALLLGTAGGVVLTAAAGARRTDSAYPRFLQSTHSEDLLVSTDDSVVPAIERLPQVAESGLLVGLNIYPVDSSGHIRFEIARALGAGDDRLLQSFDTGTLVAGRRFDPHRADEVMVNPALARLEHLHPGSRVTYRAFSQTDQQAVGDASRPIGPGVGRAVSFTVTGILVGPDDVIPDPRYEITRLYLTPAYAFAHRVTEEGYSGLLVRLRHGAADLPAFEAAVNRVTAGAAAASGQGGPGGLTALLNPRAQFTARIQRAIQPEVVALWLFAALLGATTLLIAGQALSRQLTLEADDDATLRALGMAPWQLAVATLARVALCALLAAALAVGIAVAASPLMPIGAVSAVEPSPGISVDGAVLGIGAAAIALLLLARAALPAWRLAQDSRRSSFSPAGTGDGRASRVATAVAQAGLPASTVVGVRMALEPGRGRTAVPVRSAAAGTAVAVAAVVTALTFGSSLGHLVATPRLYGWNWDMQVDNGFNPVTAGQFAEFLSHDPEVAAYAGGTYGRVEIAGVQVPAVGLVDLDGSVHPTIVEGRSATGADQVVLGSSTLAEVHLSVGDSVTVQGLGGSRRMRIVGRAVFPVLGLGDFTPTSLGEGAALTVSGLNAIGASAIADAGGPPSSAPTQSPDDLLTFALVRFKPGVDVAAAEARIARHFPPLPVGPLVTAQLRPTEIATYQRIQSTPLLLAAMLALLGVGTLAHALISAVRRRARDLAVLKTLGFVRRQVWIAVAWQATTMAAIALAVGVPLGIAAGRWAWSLFAGQVGVVDESVVPALAVAAAVPAALLLANLLAAIPGRVAARVRPALVLRSE